MVPRLSKEGERMNIHYQENDQAFHISFFQQSDQIKRDLATIYQVPEDPFVLSVPAWRFFNHFEDFSSFVLLRNLKDKVTFSDHARTVLKETKKKRKETLTPALSMEITKEEIELSLLQLSFKRELKSYQMRNLQFLLQKPVGADFSVPGSGKSTTALSLYALRKKQEPSLKLFIVCPKNVFGSWEEQNEECFHSPFSVCRLEGGILKVNALLTGTFDIFLMTYEQLLTAFSSVAYFLKQHHVSLYIDESHKMKGGIHSKIGQTLLNLSHLPRYKLLMSGTPMPNSEEDLVSQYHFLCPTHKIDATTVTKAIQSLYIRTTKQEMNLPAFSIKRTLAKMNPTYHALYQKLLLKELEQIQYESADSLEALKKINRCAVKLIQLASNPTLLLHASPELALLTEFQEATKELSPKLLIAVARAFELAAKGEKLVIWTTFVGNIRFLEQLLAPLNPVTIFGETPTGDEETWGTREAKIKAFKKQKNVHVLIANPQTASEGISLHKECQYQLFIDRNYDARLFEQAMNRTHRVGLPKDKPVIIELLLLEDSVDENVDIRLDIKLGNMYDVLNDTRLLQEDEYSEMNYDDANDLLLSILSKKEA